VDLVHSDLNKSPRGTYPRNRVDGNCVDGNVEKERVMLDGMRRVALVTEAALIS